MKRNLTIVMAIIAVALAAISCKKETPTYTVTVKVAVDETYPVGAELPVFTVKLINTVGGAEVSAQTENGVAKFTGVYSGVYNLTAASSAVWKDMTYTISASAQSKSVLKDETFEMTATAVKSSNLIFKEIYQSGCKIGEGEYDTYFRDQYYEIYNNSTETAYVDGLCIAECKGYPWDRSFRYTYDIANPDDYVFVQHIWQIPGNGTQYPLKPGESIIVAQLAINHSSNVTSPVDLLCADFEAMNGDKKLWDGTILPDGPALNMTLAVNAAGYAPQQWLTSVGNAAMIIFKSSVPLVNENFIACIEEPYSTNAVREVLRSDVLDAVNIISDETIIPTVILPTSLDAGYIWHSAPGSYTGESISRKVASTREDGTKVYQDTNNTKEDFVLNSKPVVRRDGAQVPAWHNWN